MLLFLKKLYAHGFKSIGQPVEVDLMNDVNVIMGPNGSGKSNFFECIQWVLGGMSAKQLRASSMEDVIFDGGSTGKPAEFAVGTLVFDNHDRELDIDTDEVSITRKLTRGKGTEYFINHEPAKLKDLTNLFLNKGIGKNNYAITGQNRITEFIMMKPEDIRGVIEEAAGISGFRLKKNQLLTTISNYDRDLERIDAVISEISRSLKPLKKQIKNAEIYETVKKELDEKKLFYFSTKLEELAKTSDTYKSKALDIQQSQNKDIVEKNNIEMFLEHYNNTADEYSTKLADLENIKKNIESSLTGLTKDKIMKENTLNNLIEKKESMLNNIKTLEESSNVEEEEKNNLFNSITNLSTEIDTLKNELNKTDNEMSSLKESITSIEDYLDNSKKQSTTYLVDIEKKEKDLEIIKERKDNLSNSIAITTNELNQVNNEIDTLKHTINTNKDKISDINNRLNSFKELEKQIKAIENIINTSKKIENKKNKINDIKNLLTNVSGFQDVLFNIISYDEKYINAMDTLYGSVLYNFVVDDVKTAEQCVSILKKNKIPPANFIIVSKFNKQVKSVPDIQNVIRVSDILQYDSKYTTLINNYFANNFIADNSEIAEKAWNDTEQKYRICTLDGTLYAANIIRGGYIQKDSKKIQEEYNNLLLAKQDILTFNGEEHSNIYELKGKITIFNKENENIQKQINKLTYKAETLNSAKSRKDSDLTTIEDKIHSIHAEILKLEQDKSSSSIELELKHSELTTFKSEVDNLSSLRETLLLDINKKETILVEQEKSYYVYKNNSQEQIESLKGNIDIVAEQIKLAEESLSTSEKVYLLKNEELLSANENWTSYRQELDSKRLEKDNKLNKLNVLISNISNAENELTKINFKLEKITSEIATCEESVVDVPEETEFKIFDEDMETIYNHIISLQKKIKSLGFINTDAVSEFKELNHRYEEMSKNKSDLEESKTKIITILDTIQQDMSVKYMNCYHCLKTDFSNIFTKLFNGGSAELIMDNPDNPLESGVIIKATPPGKKNKAISLLSGGEKSLAAVSFIFALLKYSPSPVVIFDEIDAALDEINVSLIADYIKENSNVQYVIVSHRKPMMKIAKALYGASMNNGITELISQKL